MSKIKIVYKHGREVDLIDLENPQAVLEYAQQEGIPIMPSWSTAEQIVQAIDCMLNDKHKEQ
jgi:hypothetical protein